jgi:hypothetical protein
MRLQNTACLLLSLGTLAAPSAAQVPHRYAAEDDMPSGEDEMPSGDDEMPTGEDELPQGDDQPADTDATLNNAPSPKLVAVEPAPACSMPPRSEGYVQVQLERSRSLDLHGVDAVVTLTEGGDGCVALAEVTVQLSSGCGIAMRFEQEQERMFSLSSFRFNAESCAELAGLSRGRYVLEDGNARLELSGDAQGACMPRGTLRIEGQLSLTKGQDRIAVALDGMRVRGDFPVVSDAALGCRRRATATPVTLNSDRQPRTRSIWPWVAGGTGLAATAGAITWYVLTRSPATGSLTLEIQ